VTLFWHQLKAEQLIFWRNRESAVFIFIFPVLLFVLLGSLYDGEIDLDDGVDYPAADVLLAGMIGYGAANTAFAGLAIMLVLRREYGILKRLRSTPLPAATYLVAVLASGVIVFALQVATLLVLGRFAYDTQLPERSGSLALLVLFGVLAFAGLGIGAAALIRSGEGASAVLNVILLPMAFLSGAFGSRDYPALLEALASMLPLKHYIDLVYDAYLQDESLLSEPLALAVVCAWAVGGAAVAAWRFGWEPRER
jgi:ABC-2 type transport system permease protein